MRFDRAILGRRLSEVRAIVGDPKDMFTRGTSVTMRRVVSGLYRCGDVEVVIEETYDDASNGMMVPALIRGYLGPRFGSDEFDDDDTEIYPELACTASWFARGLEAQEWVDPAGQLVVPPKLD